MSALTINDHLLHYEVIGKGKPVLFLHNLIGSWRYWMAPMGTLSAKFRCYAFDLWGYGDSEKDKKLYSMDRLVETTQIFLDEMGISKAAIIGHGFGARLALSYAKKYPSSVERLILIDQHNHSFQQPVDGLRFSKALEMVKKEPGVDPAIIRDSLKTDPEAFQRYQAIVPLKKAAVPALSIESQPIKDNGAPSHRLSLDMETPSLFPMLTHAAEVDRLIKEYLLLPADQIETPIEVKKYWKRLVR